jgi:hypothetical protein
MKKLACLILSERAQAFAASQVIHRHEDFLWEEYTNEGKRIGQSRFSFSTVRSLIHTHITRNTPGYRKVFNHNGTLVFTSKLDPKEVW